MATNTRKKTYQNRVSNNGFEERLSGWGSAGVRIISADDGQLVHTGTQAAMLQSTNAFLAQTIPAGRGARLHFTAHLRGLEDGQNSPVLIRLRWVDATGSFINTALEILVPKNQLSKHSWTFLNDSTNVAPTGTAGLNVRIEAPYSDDISGIVIDDIAVR